MGGGIPPWLNGSCIMHTRRLRRNLRPICYRRIPTTRKGQPHVTDWPIQWAHDALRYAKSAHAHLKVAPRAAAQDTKTHAQHFVWSLTVPATYGEDMEIIGERALVRAGKRLALVLKTIWTEK